MAKPDLSVLLADKPAMEEEGAPEEEAAEDDDAHGAAEELIDAVHTKDAAKFIAALKALLPLIEEDEPEAAPEEG